MFLAALIAALSVMAPMSPVPTAAQEATPAMMYACVVGASTPDAIAHEMPMALRLLSGGDGRRVGRRRLDGAAPGQHDHRE